MTPVRIANLVDRCVGPDVLDVGCSGGLQEMDPAVFSNSWLHGHLRKKFPEVWGVDLSERRLAIMRLHGHKNLISMDVQALEIEQRFDTIVAGEIIEHLENPGQFLKRASRHLKPGGQIILTTPYVFGIPHIAYARFKYPGTCSNREHMMWFCPATLRQLAERCGLEITCLELISDYDIPDGYARRPYFFMLRLLRLIRPALPARVHSTGVLVQMVPKQRSFGGISAAASVD